MPIDQLLQFHPTVSEALYANAPVVALESTIISHGMPYPQNVDTALSVEAAVREAGAVPATLAILDGRLQIGLSTEQIERLGQAGLSVIKVSRRDLPLVLARQSLGSTTVAATMIIARMAGIRTFATGGIGGVHRGATQSMDISADLEELGRSRVTVVCAGAKAILNLRLTLEYLETKGVPVIGYQTDEFPAFYTPYSGLSLEHRLNTPAEIARVMKFQDQLGLAQGMVIANPIPAAYALSADEGEQTIHEALQAAERKGITGKDLTPFLLAEVEQRTQGRSLQANVQLVLHNARLAAEIAVAYATLPLESGH